MSVVAGGWARPDEEETVESSDEECSSSWKNVSTCCGFSGGWIGSSMMGEEGKRGDGGSGMKSGSGSSEIVSGRMPSSLPVSLNGLIGTESKSCTMAGEMGVATSMIGE